MNSFCQHRPIVAPVIAVMIIALGVTGCKEEQLTSPDQGVTPAPTTAAIRPAKSPSSPKPTGPAPPSSSAEKRQSAKKPSSTASIEPVTVEQIRELCEAASLPPTPSLKDVPEDLLRILHDALSDATTNKNEKTMGRLALLYHALSHTREDTDRAVEAYEAVKELAPEAYQWPHYLGRLFLGRRSFERARMEFEESIRLNPDYAMNWAWIGETELARGDTEEALKHFEQYLQKVEDKTYAYLGLAAAYLNAERYDEFFEALNSARDASGDCGRIHMLRAEYFDRLDNPEAAKVERRIAQSLPSIRGAMRFDELEVQMWKVLQDSTSLLGKVQNLAAGHDFESAIYLTRAVLEENPHSDVLKEALMVLYNEAGRDDEALEAATRLLDEKPDHPAALTIAAGILLRTEQFDKLLQLAERSLAGNEDFAGGHACAGLALAGLNQYDLAEQSMLKAINAAPNNAMYLESLADIHAAQKEYEQAEKFLKKMLEIQADPPVKNEINAIAYRRLGELMLTQNQVDRAFDYYENAVAETNFADSSMRTLIEQSLVNDRVDRAVTFLKKRLQSNPSQERVRLSLAELLGRAQRGSEAIETLREGLKLTPDSVRLHFALSRILAGNGQFDDAISELQSVIELRPDQPAPYAEMAAIYLMQSNPKAAVETARRGLTKHPNFPDLANTAAWILASSADESLRDAETAVKLAKRACQATGYSHANYLDTLATAYAAAGKFDEAVQTEQRAIEIAKQRPAGVNITELEARLELFEAQKPFIDSQ